LLSLVSIPNRWILAGVCMEETLQNESQDLVAEENIAT
jgi:hypothetical protein